MGACRIQPTFDKVKPLKASVESNRSFSSRLNGDKQDESLLHNPPLPPFMRHQAADKMLQLLQQKRSFRTGMKFSFIYNVC